MARWKPLVRKDSYMPNNKMTPLVIGNGYTTDWGANGLPPEYETVTGNPVSFTTVRPYKLRQLSVAFSPVQDLNGYDSPWPAGGGKNKASLTDVPLTVNTAQTVATINQTGTFDYVLSFDLVNATYEGGTASLFIFGANGANNYRTPGQIRRVSDGTHLNALTPPFNDRFYTTFPSLINPESLIVHFESGNWGKWTGQMKNVQLELGSTATSYAPYSNICPISGWDSLTVYHSGADTSDPQTISINIGQTVYSGTVDVLTGVVTVDRVNWELGSKNWTKISGKTGVFVSTFPSPAPASIGIHETADMICSCYKVAKSGDVFGETIPSSIAQGRQGLYNGYWILNDATNAGDIETFLRGQYLCYKLAEPFTIQLTPQEVSSLLGENNVWSYVNKPLTVTYRSN